MRKSLLGTAMLPLAFALISCASPNNSAQGEPVKAGVQAPRTLRSNLGLDFDFVYLPRPNTILFVSDVKNEECIAGQQAMEAKRQVPVAQGEKRFTYQILGARRTLSRNSGRFELAPTGDSAGSGLTPVIDLIVVDSVSGLCISQQKNWALLDHLGRALGWGTAGTDQAKYAEHQMARAGYDTSIELNSDEHGVFQLSDYAASIDRETIIRVLDGPEILAEEASRDRDSSTYRPFGGADWRIIGAHNFAGMDVCSSQPLPRLEGEKAKTKMCVSTSVFASGIWVDECTELVRNEFKYFVEPLDEGTSTSGHLFIPCIIRVFYWHASKQN